MLKEPATLPTIFNYFTGREVLLSNPVLAVKKPKLKQARPNRRLTEEELCGIYGALYPGARRFFLAFCETGARHDELRKCKVGDANLQARTPGLMGHAKPTVAQYIYVDPFPEDGRRAGQEFQIDLGQK
jgi:hypothetical protein